MARWRDVEGGHQVHVAALTVMATEAAEVGLDGARVGETPLTALPVDLGTHEVVLRRAEGAERRFTVTVRVQPLTLDSVLRLFSVASRT